jgi:hypothetical protein
MSVTRLFGFGADSIPVLRLSFLTGAAPEAVA